MRRACESCPNWRKDFNGRKVCLCSRSPKYQHATAAYDVCYYCGVSTSGAEVLAELRARERLAQTKQEASDV